MSLIDTIKSEPNRGIKYSYGTAGFRLANANGELNCAVLRASLLAVARSRHCAGAAVGIMVEHARARFAFFASLSSLSFDVVFRLRARSLRRTMPSRTTAQSCAIPTAVRLRVVATIAAKKNTRIIIITVVVFFRNARGALGALRCAVGQRQQCRGRERFDARRTTTSVDCWRRHRTCWPCWRTSTRRTRSTTRVQRWSLLPMTRE